MPCHPRIFTGKPDVGFSSIIGHNYDEMYMPLDLNAIAQFNWESSYVEPITESIWKKAYNIIASCNNIIRQVEKKDSTFFRVRRGGEKYGAGRDVRREGIVAF